MIGLEKGLDVSIYAKTEFSDNEMKLIREGLEENIDVSIYAKPEMDSDKMKLIKNYLIELKKQKERKNKNEQFRNIERI